MDTSEVRYINGKEVSIKDTGGQAFPTSDIQGHYGMTLRDYFAGQAIIGIIQRSLSSKEKFLSSWAYEIADAMIAERSK